MIEDLEQAISWLSALDPGSEYGATNKEIILSRLEQDERVINKAIEILGEHRHYSSPTEEQNAQNEEIVNKAYELLKDRKCG